MSDYSSKHQHEADCAWNDCPERGTKLKVIRGHLGWYCEKHQNLE